jgi:hypothetical protein
LACDATGPNPPSLAAVGNECQCSVEPANHQVLVMEAVPYFERSRFCAVDGEAVTLVVET